MIANSPQTSEESLVEAACNGHLQSFGILYQRYHGPMVALAYSMLGDREQAQDAAQEVFVIACRDLPNLKRKDRFGAWLAGICRNVGRQMLRTRMKVPNRLPEPATEPSDQPAMEGWRQQVIQEALWSLRPADRELVVMRYFDGFSQAQICQALNLSSQAVNGRLVRTKRKIAKYLKRNGFARDDYESP
jgi:RNA polymerase sigma-70 factor (ECF subfamily)